MYTFVCSQCQRAGMNAEDRAGSVYCSKKCLAAYAEGFTPGSCLTCGDPIPEDTKAKGAIVCSADCCEGFEATH